jgi:hypothetical protein
MGLSSEQWDILTKLHAADDAGPGHRFRCARMMGKVEIDHPHLPGGQIQISHENLDALYDNGYIQFRENKQAFILTSKRRPA